MVFVYIWNTLITLILMALPAAGVRSSSRPVPVSLNTASPLAIVLAAIDSYPNTWEHLSDPHHDPPPSSDTSAYKYHAHVTQADIQTHLMATLRIRFDDDDLLFLEPQPPRFITIITRMCFICFPLSLRLLALFCCAFLTFFIMCIQLLPRSIVIKV